MGNGLGCFFKKCHGQILQHTNLEGISTVSNGLRLHQEKNTHDESDKYTLYIQKVIYLPKKMCQPSLRLATKKGGTLFPNSRCGHITNDHPPGATPNVPPQNDYVGCLCWTMSNLKQLVVRPEHKGAPGLDGKKPKASSK